jgi:hypothetical protein
VSDKQRAPLTLRAGELEVTLTASEVQALIEAMEARRRMLTRQLGQRARETPHTLEGATRRIGRLEQLEELLLRVSPSVSDPPLELDADQATLVLETLGGLSGYQRGEITGGLKDLGRALYRL